MGGGTRTWAGLSGELYREDAKTRRFWEVGLWRTSDGEVREREVGCAGVTARRSKLLQPSGGEPHALRTGALLVSLGLPVKVAGRG